MEGRFERGDGELTLAKPRPIEQQQGRNSEQATMDDFYHGYIKKKKKEYVGMSTKKIHHWSTSWKVMANEKKKGKINQSNNNNNNNNNNKHKTPLPMNSIDGDDDLRCFHGTWTNWHAPHDIGQEMYERWNIQGLVLENLSSCKQPSTDTN